MILASEIRAIALKHGIRPDVIEKDYVLSWILSALHHNFLAKEWIFKGGTCLKKCYFGEYRFSEDLDFSLKNEADLTDTNINRILDDVTDYVYEHCGLEISEKRRKITVFKNLDDRLIAQVRLYYRGPISPKSPQQWPRIKLDITSGECFTDIQEVRKVYHPYSDAGEVKFETLCYSFNELFAEKLRAFFERGRPRDIYDIVHCFESKLYQFSEVQNQFVKKCNAKKIPKVKHEQIRMQLDAAKPTWEEQLHHQIPNLSSFTHYEDQLTAYMDEIIK